MARIRPFCAGLALVLLVLQPSQALDKCKSGCNGQAGPFKFTPGTTYKYDYDGKINILVSTADGEQTTTEVKATVLLTQQADCSQVLRLQNVQIIGPDGKKRQGIPALDKPVVLNSNNGAISDFICTEPGENQNSLNLKRAIASLFQANPEKSTEVDVFGQCPTHISKTVDGDITTITKNKNLNKCAFRESITNDYLTSTFNIQSDIQSSPVLNSNLDSKQKIKGGILDSASVVENYLFIPFSVGQNGAKATVETKLTLSGTSKDTPSTKTSVPKSIMFENPNPSNVPKSNMNVILKSIKTISDNLGNVVEEKVATNFIGLVKLLRISKKADILSVYNQIRSGSGFNDKEAVKKIFLDAVLAGSTGDTIEVAIELLKNKELGPMEERQLFAGLSRARHVTENSIKTATDLLNRANLPKEAYLGVGALAGRYCQKNSCEKVDAINKIIQKLLSKLGDLKAANRKEENDMIFVLKGLTNIGFLNDAILSKLVSLAEDKKQPIRLRIATLELFQAAACKDKLRDSALKTLKDTQQDSEVRIKAYLVLAVCPNEKVANGIKAMLEKEKSHQVGGYITSHIKNLRSSTNPDKLLAKTQLGGIRTSNKFPFDPRKYSFNGEFSYYLDALGIADNVEADVIYSQKSFLPRSMNLNLTSEVFGHRFNFLELAARQENLDRVIEHYLGPQGILRKASLEQNYDNIAKPIVNLLKGLKEKVDKSLRARRDVSKADIDAINKKIQMKANELDKNLDLDLGIKTFGNEIIFMNSFDISDKLSPQGIVDGLVNKLNEGLNNLKNFEKTMRLNLMFLDAELSYPTSLGFPLRLGVDGAANVQIKTSGSIDVRDILSRSPEEDMNLKISLIPSASVSVIGRFTLDTPLIENGLKVGSTLHTSSGGQIEVKTFNAAKGLDVKFTVPVQKQELIGLKHGIIYQTRENGVVTNKDIRFTQNKDFSICVDQLAQFIGLEICADVNGPNLSGKKVPILPFPLSGNARLSVRVERGDIDTIHYRREFIAVKEGKVGVEASLETLRNNKEKAAGLNVEAYIVPDTYVKLTFNSPIKNAEGEARLVVDEKEKVLSLSVKDENKMLYSAKAGLQVDSGADKTIYHPILQYTTPQNQAPQTPPFHVEGKVVEVKNGNDVKYTLDGITLVIPNRKNIVVNGNLGKEGAAYYSDLTATDGKISGSFSGRIEPRSDMLKIQAEMKNSIKPVLNFNIKGEFKKQKNPELISSNLQITHGADLQSKTNVLTLINSLSVKNPKDPKTMELTTKNKISYPLIKLNGKFDMERAPKSMHYDTFIQYGDLKLGSEMKLKVHTKTVGDYQLELNAYDLKNKVELASSRQIVGPDDSKISNSIGLNGKKLEVSGKVKHRVKPADVNVAADLNVKLPNKNTLKVNGQVKANPKEMDTHLKILSGKTPVIDLLLKGNRAGDINGHAIVNLKDTLTVDGQISSKKGVGKGNLMVDFKPLKKTTKLDGTFTIQKPKFILNVNLYPVFNEDPKKKISIDTNNEISGTSIKTKTKVDLLGNQYSVNGNAQLGNPVNGKTTADVDINLPGPLYLGGQLSREATMKDGKVNSNTMVSLQQSTDKSSPGRKLSVKVAAKDTNPKEGIFDVTINVEAQAAPNKNANMDVTFKEQKNGDKRTVDVTNKITSSLLSNPIEGSYSVEYSKSGGSLSLKASVDPKTSLQLNGKFNGDASTGPKTSSGSIDLNLPSQTLSNLKASYNMAVKLPQKGSPGTLDLSGNLQTTSNVPSLNIDSSASLNNQGSPKTGKTTVHMELKKPVTLTVDGSGGFNVDADKKTGSVNGNMKVILPNKNAIQGSGTLTRVSPNEYTIDASLDLPIKDHKSNKLTVHTKRTEKNDISSQATLTSDGKKSTLNTELSLNTLSPKLDIQLTLPNGKLQQISASLQKPSSERLSGNVKIVNQLKDFLLEGGIDMNIEDPDNIYIKLTGNCPKLNINDVLFKIGGTTNPDKNTVNVLLTSAGKNIISGDAKVTVRQEQGKNIVEGSGDFKVGEENKSGNFKYIRTILTSDKNGENGNEISFDATIGTKAIDAELKITDKEFRYLYSFCEASKQCAHVEVDAKTTTNELAKYDGQIEITVDLRVLGLPTEFGLKSVTHRDNFLLDHTVDVHFENAANKYQYSLSIHPSTFEVSLTTPNRVISLEGSATIPNILQNGGKATGEIAFYTDKKNNPNTKSALTANVNVDKQKRTVDAEAQLNIVNMNRPLVIKYTNSIPKPDLIASGSQKLIIDIFSTPDQKIVATQTFSVQYDKNTHKAQAQNAVSVKSTGLALDVAINHNAAVDPKALTGSLKASGVFSLSQNKFENVLKLAGSPKDASLLIKVLNNLILDVQSTIILHKGQVDINSQVTALGFEPIEADIQIKNYNSVVFTRFIKSNPSDKLVVKAAVVPGKNAEAAIERQTGGNTSPLAKVSVDLGEKQFLATDVDVQGEQLKQLSAQMRGVAMKQLDLTVGKVKESAAALGKSGSDLLDKAKASVPNANNAIQFYQKEATTFKQELGSDKTLQNLGQILDNVINTVANVIGNIVSQGSNIIGRAVSAVIGAVTDVVNHVKAALLPKMQEITQELLEAAKTMVDTLSDIVANLVVKASEILKTLEPQIKVINSAIAEVLQDVVEAVVSVVDNVRNAIIQQVKHIQQELKASPIISELKAQYQDIIKSGLPSQEVLVNTIRAFFGTLRELIPIAEVQKILDLTGQYVEKVVLNKPVDNVAEMKNIGNSVFELVTKFSKAIAREIVPDLLKGSSRLPTINLDLLKRLPSIGTAKISAVDYLIHEDLTPYGRFLLRLVMNPKDFMMPSELSAIVALSMVFTFDGRIYYLPAENCNYLLAADAINGNFSIVGSFQNKIYSAVTLSDKSGALTFSKGKLLLDNAEVDLPVQKGTLRAYRTKAFYYLESTSGATVICEVNFLGCDIKVSGFYRGQLRGLLGNGNNEPYDDGALPTGKIVDKLTDLAAAYTVGPACPAIQVKEIDEPKSDPECEKMFDYDSPMRLCYPFVDRKPAKKACDYGAAQGDKDIHRMTGSLYSYLCYKSNIPIEIPGHLSEQCSNSLSPRKLDEQFNIELPGKAADVLLLVNTDKKNEVLYNEYGLALVNEITKEFKAKGIDDVVFHSIVYGGANDKPSIVTVGGQTSFKDKAPALKFEPTQKQKNFLNGIIDLLLKFIHEIQDLIKKMQAFIVVIKDVIQVIKDLWPFIGSTLESETYNEVINYPFRVEAVRVTVAITSDPCVGLSSPIDAIRSIFASKGHINMNFIAPIGDLKVKDPQTTKGVIGFTSENVITVSEMSAKPMGSPALQKAMTYSDFCSDYIVGVGGNVFVSNNLLANKDKKDQIAQTIAKNIVNSATRRKIQLECTCAYSFKHPVNPYNHCKAVDVKDA